jgi:hypothetical protein
MGGKTKQNETHNLFFLIFLRPFEPSLHPLYDSGTIDMQGGQRTRHNKQDAQSM